MPLRPCTIVSIQQRGEKWHGDEGDQKWRGGRVVSQQYFHSLRVTEENHEHFNQDNR